MLAAGDDTLQVEVGGPVAHLSQTVAVGLRGHRPDRRGDHPADHLRLRRGDGPAAAHRAVRPRCRDGARRGAAPRRRRPGLGAVRRGHGRPRRRDRLRPADRHPVPQQPRRGPGPRRATQTAMATAGRAVVFAGITVVISMLGILLMGQPAMNGFAFTVVLAVLVVMAASVTLLPAVLGFAGRNIERLHVPFVSRNVRSYDASRWYRWSRFVQRRPWLAAIGALAVLVALAAPFLGIRFGFPDAGNDLAHADHPPGVRPARRRFRTRVRRADAAHGPGFARRRPRRVRRRGRHGARRRGRCGLRRPRRS